MFQIYLLLKLDDIVCMLAIFSMVSFIVAAITVLFDVREGKAGKKRAIISTVCFFIFVVLGTFIPSTKQMAVIYVTPKIISAIDSNVELKKLPDSILSLANTWIKELEPKEKGAAKKH